MLDSYCERAGDAGFWAEPVNALSNLAFLLAAILAARRLGLLAASGLFALSLTLRTLNQRFCAWFPLGTHFLWYLLNALVLFLVLEMLISTRQQNVIS